MKGDFTRLTFRPENRYSGVLMQQGRVQLDADWNEQIDIYTHQRRTRGVDVIGECGAPMHAAGFGIDRTPDRRDLTLSPGRMYVGGVLAELHATPVTVKLILGANRIRLEHLVPDGRPLEVGQWLEIFEGTDSKLVQIDGVNRNRKELHLSDAVSAFSGRAGVRARRIPTYLTQPDAPKEILPNLTPGTYLLYLDVWERHITAVDEPTLREDALGGPDTTTRRKTVWQVRAHRVGGPGAGVTCLQFPQWKTQIKPETGRMASEAEKDPEDVLPCIVPPSAGYRGLENQLYRVEIHAPGPLGTASIKWSRDNGSLAAAWLEKNGNVLTIAGTGRDDLQGFETGGWIELTDDTKELAHEPATLVRVVRAEGRELEIDPATATGPVDRASFPRNPKVQRWDSDGERTLAGEVEIEDGIRARFESGRSYRTGDYWLIPARSGTGTVLWPLDADNKTAILESPRGVEHDCCPLAIARFDGRGWRQIVSDCRPVFPPLTEMVNFFYAGGDGQEVRPDLGRLPSPLCAGVSNGKWPVSGATIRFTVEAGSGTLNGSAGAVDVSTDTEGIARAEWTLDSTTPVQRVRAEMHDAMGRRVHLPIHYTGMLSRAEDVGVDVSKCEHLKAAGARSVQDALDIFCKLLDRKQPGIRITGLERVARGNKLVPLPNDSGVPIDELRLIVVQTDQAVDPRTIRHKPNFFVTLEVPFATGKSTQAMMNLGPSLIGWHTLRLEAITEAKSTNQKHQLLWVLRAPITAWARQLLTTMRRQKLGHRLLARLTLKGNYIWSPKTPELFLDGEVLGKPDKDGRIAFRLPSGEGHPGGDFESWFWVHDRWLGLIPNLKGIISKHASIMGALQNVFTLGFNRKKLQEVAKDFRFDVTLQPNVTAAKKILTDVKIPRRAGRVGAARNVTLGQFIKAEKGLNVLTDAKLGPAANLLRADAKKVGIDLKIIAKPDIFTAAKEMIRKKEKLDFVLGDVPMSDRVAALHNNFFEALTWL